MRRSREPTGHGFEKSQLSAFHPILPLSIESEELARQLAKVTPQQLLPHELITPEDRLSSEQFVERYGGVGDRRFKARVQQIDEALAATGLR